jgi:hypothetical protein
VDASDVTRAPRSDLFMGVWVETVSTVKVSKGRALAGRVGETRRVFGRSGGSAPSQGKAGLGASVLTAADAEPLTVDADLSPLQNVHNAPNTH